MVQWLKRIFTKSMSADAILKYPNGKRYYLEYHKIKKNNIDQDAVKVINRLQQYSHKAYLVGGSVRDLLLGRKPKDFDIVTNAKPNEIRKIFANSRLIGKRFKIVHIIFKNNKIIEVSTARSLPTSRKSARDQDELYITKDNEFGSFKEDAARRDFTVNSLFFDVRNETILDYTGGYEDLQEKLIRVIGDENISLPEDPVRMLRAIKFARMLQFELHPKLDKGIRKHRKLINKSSQARLHEEYNKIFRTGQTFDIFRGMAETELFQAMFPSLSGALDSEDGNWAEHFGDTLLGRKLQIADRMIMEHEDINTTIYYALFMSEMVKGMLDGTHRRNIHKDMKPLLKKAEEEFSLTRKESERIQEMFIAHQQFYRDTRDKNNWVKQFRNRDFFTEAFIFFKINARAQQDNDAIQKALFWEIGTRKKLPNAIRKVRINYLEE